MIVPVLQALGRFMRSIVARRPGNPGRKSRIGRFSDDDTLEHYSYYFQQRMFVLEISGLISGRTRTSGRA
jgi:hypothetical protein